MSALLRVVPTARAATLAVLVLMLVPAPAAATALLDVSKTPSGPAVQPGFVGLSTEYWDIEKLVGTDPANPDVAFEHLWQALSPGAEPSLRIGGDSTDWVWWPIGATAQPPWVHMSLNSEWTAVTRRLADDVHAKLILGINLEGDSKKVAAAEANAFVSGIGKQRIQAFELGNEPDLYPTMPFYWTGTNKTQEVTGRPLSYGPAAITDDFDRISKALPADRIPVAGPAYSNTGYLRYVPGLVASNRRLKLVTVHTYPLESERCNGGHPEREGELFTAAALSGLAGEVASWASAADGAGASLRADEMNSVTCGGQAGFSDTFGPALWALNVLPLYAETAVRGVNFAFETYTAQNLIAATDTSAGWTVSVQPEYYGLLAFAQLAPPGSRMLELGAEPAGLLAWADRTPSHETNAVLTNTSSKSRTVRVATGFVSRSATVRVLSAGRGGLAAARGVSLGGQTVDPKTGILAGARAATVIKPRGGAYTVTVPAASAAIVTMH